MPKDQEHSVEIASESALIVWDAKERKEHFIRRASFQAKVPSFGFLVPTPSRPELAEAPDDLFALVEDWTKPEIRTEKRYVSHDLIPTCSGAAPPSMNANGGAAVVVLAHVHDVAGYDADVLRANDTQALRAWLQVHGYVARPALMKWLHPYVQAAWIITAFQIAKKEQPDGKVAPQAVRMSFATDRPFFPYSEPEDQRAAGNQSRKRMLRIFFWAAQRFQGALEEQTAAWDGETAWAGRLDDEKRRRLVQTLSPGAAPAEGSWLTVFDDQASVRRETTDLFFSPSKDQSEVRRPPLIRYELIDRYAPDQILGAVVCAGTLIVPMILVWWLRWRRARVA
jgi:hypothetical protein